MRKTLGFTLSIILLLLIASGLFYWYQWRPAQIKHQCSWVKMHSNAILGRPAMTKEQLVAKHIIRSCNTEIAKARLIDPNSLFELGKPAPIEPLDLDINTSMTLFNATSCIDDGNSVIREFSKPVMPVPARDWYQAATKQQYDFCLHDNGL